MKTLKYFRYIMLALIAGAGFTSCEDDDLGDAPRLFRPIASIEKQNNNVVSTWDNIKGATSYELELLKADGKDEAGDPIFVSYRTELVTSSPFTFADVEWDEQYKLKIKAVGDNIESGLYETDALSVTYPTKLQSTRVIDVAVLVTWKADGEPITSIKIVPEDPAESTVDAVVSQAEYESGQVAVYGLNPATSYKLYAYSGAEQTGDTYEGRLLFKTSVAEDFDAIYGAGKYLDLRSVSDSAEVLLSAEVKAKMNEIDGLAIILKGGFQYDVTNAIKFEKSVTYTTGLSLEGNAIFIQSGGLQSNTGAVIDNVTFKRINFISDKARDLPISATTDKGFGGRQVYNVNNSGSTVNNMVFEDCLIEGYRAIVRLQGATDGVQNITFKACTINGIGDQGVVTTTNQATAKMETVTFENSTITNIIMLADLRASATGPTFNIKNCTFCYAPVETTANANTPLLRLAANPTVLNIENTIFGPSLATAGSAGGAMSAYTAGTAGSIMINGTAVTLGVTNSYKTNYDWTTIGTATYPIDGLESLSVDETVLFKNPSEDNYGIDYTFNGAKNSGAVKWRMP